MVYWIRSRLEVLRRILAARWVRASLAIWAVVCNYDTSLSQLIPESIGTRLPRVRDAVAMTSGFLSIWGWLLVLAGIVTAACLEYAYRRAQPPRFEKPARPASSLVTDSAACPASRGGGTN